MKPKTLEEALPQRHPHMPSLLLMNVQLLHGEDELQRNPLGETSQVRVCARVPACSVGSHAILIPA
eukprot:scaffold185634_cov16-Tisochrysis_lutea.AAC.1